MTRLSTIFGNDSGGVLLETTFAMSSLILILLGIMEFSRALYADAFIGYAAHSASRYAMVRGASWNPTACSNSLTANCMAGGSDVVNYVKNIAPLGVDATNNLTVSPLWPGTSAAGGACVGASGPASPGCVVQVQVSYKFFFVLPFISKVPLLLQSTSAVTISR